MVNGQYSTHLLINPRHQEADLFGNRGPCLKQSAYTSPVLAESVENGEWVVEIDEEYLL